MKRAIVIPMSDSNLVLQVLIASTRPGRSGKAVAEWVIDQARAHGKFSVECIDLAEVNLPLFNEPRHPRLCQYEHEHTRKWAEIISRGDAFVFVTPEYDHATPAALSNAIQYLVLEWSYKPVGFASYGGVAAGTRGVQMTKQLVAALKMVPMVESIAIPFFSQYIDPVTGTFDPGATQVNAGIAMFDELHKWAVALKQIRPA
jgi:NAD(P)H-dependent FMN reductase